MARNLKDRKSGEHYAVLCTEPVPVRIDALSSVRGMEHPAVNRLVDWGTVHWGPHRRNRFVIIYERPQGGRIMEAGVPQEPMSEDLLLRGLMTPVVAALKELNTRGLTCGGIRPANLFRRETNAVTFVLGDFLSAPQGYGQPVLVETIERAMAIPAGRGVGQVTDDLYSLGVTMLLLLLGQNPFQGMDDQAILQAKIERGTFSAMTGGVRINANLMEPLRGLTMDETKHRWSLNDAVNWLAGRRLAPKQQNVVKKSTRSLDLNGMEAWTARTAARALAVHPASSVPLIQSGDLDKWVRRSLGDEQRADATKLAVDSASIGGRRGSPEDRLVARVAIALDPPAPIRYRGVAVMPDGIGAALANAILDRGNPQAIAEIIMAQIPSFWVNTQVDFRPEHVQMGQRLDNLRNVLEMTGPGFGIERVMYELNPTLPCLSPLVRDKAPLGMQDVMVALEFAAGTSGRGREPMDRQIAAFIGARVQRFNDRLFGPLAGGEDAARRLIAVLSIYAEMQRRFGPPVMPNLAGWLVALMAPAFKRYRNVKTRDKVAAAALKLAKEGQLEALLKQLDDPEMLHKDQVAFHNAQREYAGLTREMDKLRKQIADRGGVAASTGRQIAAITSALVAMGILALTVFLMTQGA